MKPLRIAIAIAIAGCTTPALAGAQLSSTQTRSAREAVFVAAQAKAISPAEHDRINGALISSSGLSLAGDTAAARIVRSIRTATGDAYAEPIDALISIIGVQPAPPSAAPAPPPVVVAPAPPVSSAGLSEADVRRIVAEEIAKRPVVSSSSLPNRVDGDLVVTGRLCVVTLAFATGCRDDAQEIVQIRQAGTAAIAFEPNMNGGWRQAAMPAEAIGKAGWGSIGMSPDLGLRMCQNQRWTNTGQHVAYIVPGYGVSCYGPDSRGHWSFNFQNYGDPSHRTQQMILFDLPNVGLSFITMRPDRKLCFVTSSQIFAFDQVWCAPTKEGQ